MFHVVVRCTVYLKCKLCPDHPDPQNVKIIRKDTPDPQNVKVIKKDPHLKKQVKQIEGVQRRAAGFIKNCYTQEPGTVTNLLNKLTWTLLKVQRTIKKFMVIAAWLSRQCYEAQKTFEEL